MINQKEIDRLEKEMKPHTEQICQCHEKGDCTCSSVGDTSFSAEGWHCTPEFLLQCEIDTLRWPRP